MSAFGGRLVTAKAVEVTSSSLLWRCVNAALGMPENGGAALLFFARLRTGSSVEGIGNTRRPASVFVSATTAPASLCTPLLGEGECARVQVDATPPQP